MRATCATHNSLFYSQMIFNKTVQIIQLFNKQLPSASSFFASIKPKCFTQPSVHIAIYLRCTKLQTHTKQHGNAVRFKLLKEATI